MATTRPRLIWCADGNTTHSLAAHDAGWLYGARLPAKGLAPLPLYFADQDWRRPDRGRYMAALERHRPALATVLDWEHECQLLDVLCWAGEAAQHATDAVLVIPKVPGLVGRIPRRIGGKEVWLAYSVPTTYGGSPIGLWELRGWPVHLLGGSPQRQYEVWTYLRGICDVRSIDGNMVKKQATKRCLYWTLETTHHGHWQPLNRAVEMDAPDECVRRSVRNIAEAWDQWGAIAREVLG